MSPADAPTPAPSKPRVLRVSSRAQSRLSVAVLLLLAGLCGALASFLHGEPALAIGVLALLLVVLFWPTRLELSASEVRVSWLGLSRAIPYAQLGAVGVYRWGGVPCGAELRPTSGAPIRLPVFHAVLARQRETLRGLILAIESARVATPSN